MIHRFINWLKGSKHEPKVTLYIDRDLQSSLEKSINERKHVEELLNHKATGNVLADTWGGRD